MDTLEFCKVVLVNASTTSRAVVANVAGLGAEGDDEGAERYDDCEAPMPAGLMAVPSLTDTTEAVGVRRGDEMVLLCIIDKGAPAQAVESGETRLYGVGASNATAIIRIRATGKIEITAKSGQDIVLNGGTLKVARDTDQVDRTSALSTWMTQVTTYINGVAPGTVTPFVGPAIGNVAGGATTVKA
jgi:hypothetical protein